jgi:hypothetical protein
MEQRRRAEHWGRERREEKEERGKGEGDNDIALKSLSRNITEW